MKASAILTAVACLLALAVPCHAAKTIASPAIFGAFSQRKADCRVRNIGQIPVSVSVAIFDESGGVVGSRTCNNLMEGDYCSVFIPISFGVAYACSATPVVGSAKNIRGTLVLYAEPDLNDWEPLRSAVLR